MNVFMVIGIVGVAMVIMTSIIALTVSRLSTAVTTNYEVIEQQKVMYKPAQTFGFSITQVGDKEEQYKDAQRIAAKAAAMLPRGANMRIGRKGHEQLQTASKNLKNDPISSFKIAEVQGWSGLGDFSKLQEAATAVAGAPVATAQPTQVVKRKLVAGKDYEVVAITDGMAPADKRKARIANAKSKQAAYKALKESGADMVVAAAPVAAAPVAAAAPSAEELASAAGIEEPTYIVITDDMDPADKRKARIENSKMKSAYKKAMKAAGISASSAPAAAPPPAAVAAPPPPAPVEEAPAVPSDIPLPDLIEITDGMEAAEKRAARIANSKAKSAYKKALKAAGIDPKTVKI